MTELRSTRTIPRHRPSPASRDTSDVVAALTGMAQLARLPESHDGWQQVLGGLSEHARRAVPIADWCSLALGDPAHPDRVGGDSSTAQELDGAQEYTDEGPSVDAFEHRLPVLVDDLTDDARWPRLTACLRFHDTPTVAVLAVPLTAGTSPEDVSRDRVEGVLTFSSSAERAFSTAAELDRALTVATLAGSVISTHRHLVELRAKVEQLYTAMSSRATIEQAKGLVAGWLRCGVEDAFTVLAEVSQRRNVKLRDLAALVVSDPAATDLRGLLVAHHVTVTTRT